MDEPFKSLVETSSLWLPSLTWLAGHLAASKPGRKIDTELKKRVTWLKDPQAEIAFHEAFSNGIEAYERKHGGEEVASAVIEVLRHVAENDTSNLDRATILCRILAIGDDKEAINGIISRNIFALKGKIISIVDVTRAMDDLLENYLQPAFFAHPYFTERVGLSEVISLLKEIYQAIIPSVENLDTLENDYRNKIINLYDLITMQGISPKVHNRTIGIRMEDVFIQLKAKIDFQKSSEKRFSKSKVDLMKWFLPGDLDNQFETVIDLAEQAPKLSETAVPFIPLAEIISDELQESIQKIRDVRVYSEIIEQLASGLTINNILKIPRVVIQGHPGSGKSTLTRYIAWAICSNKAINIGKKVTNRIPIRVRAIELGEKLASGQIVSFEEFLYQEADRYEALFKYAVTSGKALIMIDGLDEVGKTNIRIKVKECVDEFLADPAFSDNNLLITTRIVGYVPSGLTGQLPHLTLIDLEDTQISLFIESWYKVIKDEASPTVNVEDEKNQLMDAIFKNDSIHRMAKNPLLLTIIALIKWQGRALPEQRVLLYDAAAQTLIRSWPLTQRHVEIEELFVREWLAPIAWKIMGNVTSDVIDEYSLMEDLVASMLRLRSMPIIDAKEKSQKLLEDITVHSGIVLPRGTDPDGRNLYGFLHQTFTEYLCAYFLAGRWEDGNLNLTEYAHDPYWREVLLLTAGHLGTQRRAKAGKFIEDLLALRSSEFEEICKRDLILVGWILADGVPVGPGELVEKIINDLIYLFITTNFESLFDEIGNIFNQLKSTEYFQVFIRLLNNYEIDERKLLLLSQKIGTRYIASKLYNLINEGDVENWYSTVEILVENDDPFGNKVFEDWLTSENYHTELDVSCNLSYLQGSKKARLYIRPRISIQDKGDWFIMFYPRRPSKLRRNNYIQGVLNNLLHSQRKESVLSACILLGERNGHCKHKLEELLDDNDPFVQIKAAIILNSITEQMPLKNTVHLLKNNNWLIKLSCLLLSDQNFNDQIPILEELLNDVDPRARLYSALICLENDSKIELCLEKLLTLIDEQDSISNLAITGIVNYARQSEFITITIDEVRKRDVSKQVNFASSLLAARNRRGFKIIEELLNNDNEDVIISCSTTLLRHPYPPLLKLAIQKLSDMNLLTVDSAKVHLDLENAQKDNDIRFLFYSLLLQSRSKDLRFYTINHLSPEEDPIAFRAIFLLIDKLLQDIEPIETINTRSDCIANSAFAFLNAHLSPNGNLVFEKNKVNISRRRYGSRLLPLFRRRKI